MPECAIGKRFAPGGIGRGKTDRRTMAAEAGLQVEHLPEGGLDSLDGEGDFVLRDNKGRGKNLDAPQPSEKNAFVLERILERPRERAELGLGNGLGRQFDSPEKSPPSDIDNGWKLSLEFEEAGFQESAAFAHASEEVVLFEIGDEGERGLGAEVVSVEGLAVEERLSLKGSGGSGSVEERGHWEIAAGHPLSQGDHVGVHTDEVASQPVSASSHPADGFIGDEKDFMFAAGATDLGPELFGGNDDLIADDGFGDDGGEASAAAFDRADDFARASNAALWIGGSKRAGDTAIGMGESMSGVAVAKGEDNGVVSRAPKGSVGHAVVGLSKAEDILSSGQLARDLDGGFDSHGAAGHKLHGGETALSEIDEASGEACGGRGMAEPEIHEQMLFEGLLERLGHGWVLVAEVDIPVLGAEIEELSPRRVPEPSSLAVEEEMNSVGGLPESGQESGFGGTDGRRRWESGGGFGGVHGSCWERSGLE